MAAHFFQFPYFFLSHFRLAHSSMKKSDSKTSFTKNLLQWNKKNERSFPWKETNDPYKIWLSEIILQQTRVEQGLPYYLKMVKLFPTVTHLAKAKEDTILKAWQGLGYYSRARNLQSAAKYIVEELKGKFPDDYEGWRKVKGVGPYTAAAIVSFAYNLPHAVVDGNVFRVLSRYFGIDTPIDSGEGKNVFTALANELIAQKEAGRFNQAIMDLGATVCKPASPQCNSCPVQKNCVALKKNLIDTLPVKGKKLVLKDRYFHYIIAENEKGFLVEKRKGNDIWKGLYQFPMIEADKFLSPKKLMEHPLLKNISSNKKLKLTAGEKFIQLLSHQRIHAKFFILSSNEIKSSNFEFKQKLHLKKLAVPKLIEHYLKIILH